MVNGYKVKLIYGCVYTPYSIFDSKREKSKWQCSQHLDVFQLFGHGKGYPINCMAHTLIRMINEIVGPTKMYFGERCPIHQPQFAAKFFWHIERNVVPFMTGIIKAAWGTRLTQLSLKIAKLLSRGLRPIFGGGVRNNCNTICTWNVLWMLTMMTIVLARVCDLPRQGRVSMCMNQWWHIHIAFTHITTWIQGTLL